VASHEFLNPGECRSAEKTKTDKYKFLCQWLGLDLGPIIFTTSGGMGEQLHWQRQTGTHTLTVDSEWSRVEVEDEMMTRRIGPWVAERRKALWQARFAVAVANCNARMILKSLSAYH
jgi:hypothetical protein